MTATAHDREIDEPVVPTAKEADLAARGSQILAAHLGRKKTATLRLADSGEELTLPTSALRLFQILLEQMGQGHAVSLVPVETELTTQQAAALLNVSRPYVVKLLEQGEIAFRQVGTHRRLRLQDVLAYKCQQDYRRRRALSALVEQAEDLDMGY